MSNRYPGAGDPGDSDADRVDPRPGDDSHDSGEQQAQRPGPSLEKSGERGDAGASPSGSGAHLSGIPRPGSIQRQEPGRTQPRPPTVAEARARDKARRRAEAARRAAAEAEEARRRKRNRVMIGGAAVVGVAALVGGGYLAYRAVAAPEVTAYCTRIDENGKEVVVEDRYCDTASRGSPGMGGILILNGMQYRYYYGGNNTIGQPPIGGSTVKPKGAEIKTKSGTVIQRGGLGSKGGGGS